MTKKINFASLDRMLRVELIDLVKELNAANRMLSNVKKLELDCNNTRCRNNYEYKCMLDKPTINDEGRCGDFDG